MLKRATALIVLLSIFIVSIAIPCFADTVTPIAPGINCIHLQRETEGGTSNVTIISADISRPDVRFGVVYPKDGASKLQNVLEMAKAAGATAAINADFFAKESGKNGSAVGYDVSNGNMVSNPNKVEKMATLAFDADENPMLDYFTADMNLILQNGMTLPVKNMNKYDPLDGIVIYNRFWGSQSLGANGTLVEAVVIKDKITEIRHDMPSADIPQDGYIIAGLTDYTNLFEMIKVGETIKLDIKLSPDFKAVEAIGGGTILVKDGQPYEFTHNIKGVNPRSVIGLDKTGKILYLIAVDGRGAGGSVGMTQSELRDFLIDYGVYNALNLDGGGSTQLVSRLIAEKDLKVQNVPSESYLRPVANSAAVFSTAVGGAFEGILLDLPKNMDVGKIFELKIKAYDNAYLPMDVDLEKVKFEVSGVHGNIKGKYFTPSQTGKAVVTATYNGVQAKGEVIVTPSETSNSKVIYDFETLNGKAVPYPEYVNTAYKLSSEQSSSGKYSGKLFYDFTPKTGELQSTALQFDTPFEIAQGAKSMGIWVYGNAESSQWLRAMLKDADGQLQRLTLAKSVNWDGWKYIELNLADVKLPAKLTRFYVVQPTIDTNSSGSLFFDDLQINSENSLVNDDPIKGTLDGYKTGISYATTKPNNLLNMLQNHKLYNGLKPFDTAVFVNEDNKKNDKNFVELKKFYSKTNGETQIVYVDNLSDLESQWDWLIEQIKTSTASALAVVFNSKLALSESQANTLQDELAKAAVRDITVFCISPDETETVNQKDGVRYITIPRPIGEISKVRDSKLYRFELYTKDGAVKYDIKAEAFIK